MHRKWDDVLFVDNNPDNGLPDSSRDLQFASWQWYKDGQPIDGATEQFYYEPGGLNGNYQVQMTAIDGTIYRSCVEAIESEQKPRQQVAGRKVIEDGQMLIILGGKTYTIFGLLKGGQL